MVYIQNEFVYVFEDYYFVKNADDSDYIDIFYLQNESEGVFGDHYFLRKLQNNDYIHKILHQYVSQYALWKYIFLVRNIYCIDYIERV